MGQPPIPDFNERLQEKDALIKMLESDKKHFMSYMSPKIGQEISQPNIKNHNVIYNWQNNILKGSTLNNDILIDTLPFSENQENTKELKKELKELTRKYSALGEMLRFMVQSGIDQGIFREKILQKTNDEDLNQEKIIDKRSRNLTKP